MQSEIRRYDRIKRILDVAMSTVGLVITAPIQVVIAGVVLATLGQPVVFRQPRPGLNGEVFELAKFRTMRQPDATHTTDADRLTSVGKVLRSTSLDELPTLWNVLKGDMSLVGPRPLRVHYLPLYSPEQARRHEVRPGVTGLAQVRGRNLLSWDERFKADIEYVDRRSLRLDLSVLIKTVMLVIRRTGVAAEGEVTMFPFTGEPSDES